MGHSSLCARHESRNGRGTAKANTGMAKQSPTKWILTVAGIIDLARVEPFVFLSTAKRVSGIAAALDMLPKPVMAAGNKFFKWVKTEGR